MLTLYYEYNPAGRQLTLFQPAADGLEDAVYCEISNLAPEYLEEMLVEMSRRLDACICDTAQEAAEMARWQQEGRWRETD